ncbi:MAG: DUF4446 family protein [bacterium]|nr:DUF4446 family protein [bacterium]
MDGEILVYLTASCLAFSVIVLIALNVLIVQYRKLFKRYDAFMRGKDAETLEELILMQMDEVRDLKAEDRAMKEVLRGMKKSLRLSYQKFGMVKYNAFQGMGGNLSFAFAMLNEMNSGFVLNAVHSRDGCYLYLKDVEQGETEVLLGAEEKEALERALGYHDDYAG